MFRQTLVILLVELLTQFGSLRDPILGDNSSPGATFLVPVPGKPTLTLNGISRFVTCRGGAYCFLPSLTAVRYLASLTTS